MPTLRLAAEIFEDLFREGQVHHFRVVKGIPEKARLIGIGLDANTGVIHAKFEGEPGDLDIFCETAEPSPKT